MPAVSQRPGRTGRFGGSCGPFPLEGVDFPTWLLQFDREGECTSVRTREQLLEALGASRPDHVIFFSHGWNNDFALAGQLYSRLLQRLPALLPAGRAGRLLFVGVLWPSTWWPATTGPRIAAGAPSVAPQRNEILVLESANQRVVVVRELSGTAGEAPELQRNMLMYQRVGVPVLVPRRRRG